MACDILLTFCLRRKCHKECNNNCFAGSLIFFFLQIPCMIPTASSNNHSHQRTNSFSSTLSDVLSIAAVLKIINTTVQHLKSVLLRTTQIYGLQCILNMDVFEETRTIEIVLQIFCKFAGKNIPNLQSKYISNIYE